jgi:anti-sigma regulatory factor (Ser/Thr protein kinase)
VNLSLTGLQEDTAWREHIREFVSGLPKNVVDIWYYGCTEMINNAVDHSGGSTLTIAMARTAIDSEVDIFDDGVGIFRKIKDACGLEDERHAVLELAKGKLTTDPQNHTGEGIFFTSRMMDDFTILSGEVFFSHEFEKPEDWILQREKPESGTGVFMLLANETDRTSSDVFRRYAAEEDDYGFTKTVVPVRLARERSEQLVSRSQAKRLLARVDRFATVILDFSGVEMVGRAFADEIFRVFARANPRILIIPINANAGIVSMIASARGARNEEQPDSGGKS